jgi:membrane-bound ClpP family serine protease
MAEWFIVIGLVVFGLALIVIEVVFIPGTTIVGILGCIFGIAALYLSFEYFGNTIGAITTVISLIAGISVVVISLKSGVWEKFSLKSTMEGKVNGEIIVTAKVGDVGKAISTLKPIGNGLFDEKILEVRSSGDYIPADAKIQISKIVDSKIFVESILN